jgi:hypothetical protein
MRLHVSTFESYFEGENLKKEHVSKPLGGEGRNHAFIEKE